MSDEQTETSIAEESSPPRLSDDGILLVFAGVACLLAATTALSTEQFQPIIVFALLAGVSALTAFAVDVITDYVPGNSVHLLVGAAALVAGLFAIPGRNYVNIATLFAASALVLWRVYDVEFRGAER